MSNICKLTPDKCKDIHTGKEYDSQLFNDLRAVVDYDTAWNIYANVTKDTSLKEKYPWVTTDHLGQPTLESLKNVGWVSEVLQKKVLDKESAIHQLNKQYGVQGTSDFSVIASHIGALERNPNINRQYTAKIVKGSKNGSKVYTLEVVPKTVKNEVALQNFLEQQSFRDRLIAIAAKAGIGVELVDNLSDDISGQFDNHNPERVFRDIFKIIKINTNKDIGEQTKAVCEEIGHTVASIYESNELTKQQYKRFTDLIYSNRNRLDDILTKEDIAEIETSKKVSAECAAKVIAYSLYEGKGKVQSTGNWATRGVARLFASTINMGRKLLLGVLDGTKSIAAHSLNTLSNNALFRETSIKPQTVDALEYDVKQEILITARKMSNSFLNSEISGEQALQIKQKVNRETRVYSDLASKVTTAYENFLQLMEKNNMIDSKNISVYKQHMVNARRAYFDDKGGRSIIKRTAAEQNYIKSIYNDLAEILADLQESFTLFTDDFRTMCAEALKEGSSDYDMLEASVTVANIPEQLSLLNKGRLAIQLINELNDAYSRNDLLNTQEERTSIGEIMSSLDNMVENIKGIYYRLSKGAFVAQMIVINNGKNYIDRGARIMEIADRNGRKSLQSYKGRRIYLSELVSELDTADGYFDMSWFGKSLQKAGNSVDPITQLLDQMTKYNKFTANQENLRWQKVVLDLRKECKVLTGSHDTSFMFELDEEGNRTGNIRQRTKWGVWEKEYQKFKEETYAQLKEQYADELEGMTNLERSQFLLNKYQEHYIKWHKENSILLNPDNLDEIPDMFLDFDYQGNIIGIKDYSSSKISKPKTYTNRLGEDISLDVDNELNFSSMKFVPNPYAFGGKYYDSAYDTDLTEDQKYLIEKYLELKAQLDTKVNRYKPDATLLYRLPQFRGTTMDRFSTEGFFDTLGNKWTETIFEDLQDEDFGDISSYNSEDQNFIPELSSSVKEIRHRIPIFGVNKLNNMEALTTDVFRGLMAYAAMANNVECLSTTADVAMLGLDVLQGRSIEGITELGRAQKSQPFSNIYQRYEKYVEMQIFGQYATMNPIPFGKKAQLSLQKITRKLSKYNSWLLLAGKITGGNVNTGTGLFQIIKEACVGEHFTKTQFFLALLEYCKYGLESNFNINGGFAANMRTNALYRFISYMDAQNKNNEKFRDMDTKLPQILKLNYEMCWYENGDHLIQSLPYIMKAMNTKLYKREKDGTYTEVGNMWEVFKKSVEEGSFRGEGDSVDEEGETGWGNPFSYEDIILDENTGETTKIRRNYYVQTAKSKQEYMTKGITPAETFEKRLGELDDEIRAKETYIDNLKKASPSSYLDEREYKKAKRELEILEAQYSKYVELLNSGNYNITDGDFDKFDSRSQALFQDSCRDLCDNLHGIYNSLDAVAVSQSVFGAMALTMKKFYLGYANNAFLTSRDNIAQQHDVEGYGVTMGKLIRWYLFTAGTNREIDTRVATAMIGMSAGIVGTAISLGMFHSLIGSGLCTALTALSSKFINNKDFKNKMVSDGFSLTQSLSLKRGFTQMYFQIAFALYDMLFGYSNYKFVHSDEDDDKEDDIEEDEWIIETGPDGEQYRRKKTDKDRTKKEKLIRKREAKLKKMQEEIEGVKATEFYDYNFDAKILEAIFGEEDYSNKAYAFSGGEKHQKTPGILSTLLFTEKDDKTGKYIINKGSREDIIGGYKAMAMLNYFMHRWGREQAVFSPFFVASNPTEFIREANTQKGEILSGLAPVAMSQTLALMVGLLDFGTKEQTYPHDKITEGWDMDRLKYANEYPEEDIYNSPLLDRFIYRVGNLQHTIAGDRVNANYFFNQIPGYNTRPFFSDPVKAQHSWDFQRSAR